MPVYKREPDWYGFKGIIVKCDCGNIEHQVEFLYDPDDLDLWMEIHLADYQNIFQRTWKAIKYIFGYHCKYGHWDCLTLQSSDVEKIRAFLLEYVLHTERNT